MNAEKDQAEARKKAMDLTANKAHLGEGTPFYHPHIKDISKRLVVYDDNALFFIKGEWEFRKKLVELTVNPWFENFIIFVIFLNSM